MKLETSIQFHQIAAVLALVAFGWVAATQYQINGTLSGLVVDVQHLRSVVEDVHGIVDADLVDDAYGSDR